MNAEISLVTRYMFLSLLWLKDLCYIADIMASLTRNLRLLGETTCTRMNLSEATITCARLRQMRPFSVGTILKDEEKYPSLPQAKHFPIKKDTMLPPGSFAGKVLLLPSTSFDWTFLKVVLVTGGGTGLGKGMSMKFSSLGAKVLSSRTHGHES